MRRLLRFINTAWLCVAFCACGQLDLGEGNKDSSSDIQETDSISPDELISVAAAMQGEEGEIVSVVGYYLGYIKGTALSNAIFTENYEEPNTNLLLGDEKRFDETRCLPIALPAGTLREDLNIYDHPELQYQRIVVRGPLTTYFKVKGIKKPISWRLATSLDTPNDTISEEHEEGTDSIEPVPVVVSFPRLLPQAMPVTRGR